MPGESMASEDNHLQPFEELLQQARRGDESARNALLQKVRESLRPLVENALGPKLKVRADESDMLQKVLIQVLVDLPQFRGETCPEFMGWVRRILERDLQELLEREKFTSKRSIDREEDASHEVREAMAQQTSPSQRLIRKEHSRLVLEAIELLDEEFREVMQRKYLRGQAMADIARQLGKSESAVVRLLASGMTQLKVILKQRGITDA
jgi:RNA polymerase sigma-70 factor (ECF subfamily)